MASWIPGQEWSPRTDTIDLWITQWSEEALGCEPSPHLLRCWSRRQLERYQGIQDPAPRRRWAWTQIAMRDILGGYIEQGGDALEIRVDDYGRPAIKGEGPSFSLSHCGERVLLAVDPSGAPLGVDLERRDPSRRLASIVERFFCAEDQTLFQALESKAQLEVFYRWWTQKEALAKAHGQGLSSGLLRLPLGRQGAQQELQWGDARWVLRDLGTWGDFQASIGMPVSRRDVDLRTFWPMPKELA